MVPKYSIYRGSPVVFQIRWMLLQNNTTQNNILDYNLIVIDSIVVLIRIKIIHITEMCA